ncbi:MAG: DUF2726 domain-containing protein [Thermoguttaceae bacterium]
MALSLLVDIAVRKLREKRLQRVITRSIQSTQPPADEPPINAAYKRATFFHKAEEVFYNRLRERLPPNIIIFSKVRMIDVIEPVEKENQRARNQIMQKHLDFILVNAKTGTVIAAIELDGYSHQHAAQQQRDAVKDRSLESAGVPLVRVDQNNYTIENVAKEINDRHRSIVQPTK